MPTIEVIDTNSVRTIAINRPDRRNALDHDTIARLRDAVDEAVALPGARAIVLTGRGGAFSAGADVREWAEISAGKKPRPARDWVSEAVAAMTALQACPKPTLAMVDGAATGAGLDLALVCDFRFASDRARFICSYTRVGYPPDAGSSWLLPRLIGLEAAKRFVFTGEAWAADKALKHGMVTEVHPVDGLEAAAMAFAAQLAAGPTIAIGHAKRLLETGQNRSFPEQLEEERKAGKICGATEDHKEGLAAANERREPRFVGR